MKVGSEAGNSSPMEIVSETPFVSITAVSSSSWLPPDPLPGVVGVGEGVVGVDSDGGCGERNGSRP